MDFIPEEHMDRIDHMRWIVDRRQAAEVEGHMVDLFSASAYLAVHDRISVKNREDLDAKSLPFAIDTCFKVLNRVNNR